MPNRKILRIKEPPQGLVYVKDFLTEEEEKRLIEFFANLEFYDFVLQGQAAKRKVHHFGYRYEFYSQHVEPIEEFPDWLKEIRDRAATFAGLKSQTLEQALIAKYVPGAGIGWHRDAPAFGPTVVGVFDNFSHSQSKIPSCRSNWLSYAACTPSCKGAET